jgi:gliding motility-associated-like protein
VTITDPSNGCSNTATAIVTPNSNVPNILVAAGSQIPCTSSVTTVNASSTTSGVTYSWSGAGIVSGANTATATVNAAGNYTVTVTDPSNGCAASATENVTVASTPTVVIGPPITSGCSPVCVTFTNSASVQGTYSWTFGDGTSGNVITPTHCYVTPGTYTANFTYTDLSGCKGSSSASVVVYPLPHADFNDSPQPATILEPTVQFTDASYSSITSWHWTFGDNSTSTVQNPSHLYADTGSYPVQLIVTSVMGCKDSVVKLVHIDSEYALYVPDAFSPNGDDLNEVFEAKGEGIKDFKLYVFDRWGAMVFYSNNISKGWDGRYQGKGTDIVQQDVYVWKIELKTFKNEPRQLSGQVNLIK